jgi:hypothetical protein
MSQRSSAAFAVAMGFSQTTVQPVLRSEVESPKKQTGRKPAITRRVRERLDTVYHRMTYKEIALLEGVQADRKVLMAAFDMEYYGRCVATLKPLLTEIQKKVRLA